MLARVPARSSSNASAPRSQHSFAQASRNTQLGRQTQRVTAKRSIMNYTDKSTGTKKVTLLPGDGIGPEVTESVVGIFQAAGVPVDWERFDAVENKWTHEENPLIFQEVISSIARTRVCLKAPFHTPSGAGYVSRNLKLRKALDLFANVVPVQSVPGLLTRHKNMKIDLVVVRENTQGEYSGFEQEVEPGVVQSLKVTTDSASRRVAEYAFQYAKNEGRKKVTCIHKANIQKQTDGLFLKVCREVSKNYSDITYNEMIVDNACMQMVMNPTQFDVLVLPNLYGNILTNVAAGLVGGPGVVGGANISTQGIVLFEPGARHVAQDIAGQNKANPVAMILSSTMMLRHLELADHAKKIDKAVFSVLSQGKQLTADLGGTTSTKEFTRAVIDLLE